MKTIFIIFLILVAICFYIRWSCGIYDSLIYLKAEKNRHNWSERTMKIFSIISGVVILICTPLYLLASLFGDEMDGKVLCKEYSEFFTQKIW